MAQQEEPLYDFPEPAQPLECKFQGHRRGQSSLRSISILDRLLLTVPVWLQLSINPATALHILQREPAGTFLVRKSRTSKRNVLCVRVPDDTVPTFVQQFGIREEKSALNLEKSVISFPDLPRLISFYCVSRDVLPFPLELPEAIARATSHKELESISHMGIEFWNSQLNVRGPRETAKTRTDEEKRPHTDSPAESDSALHPPSETQIMNEKQQDCFTEKSKPHPTLFHEFCPISTRSPRELDCGSGFGALCFINPLFLDSQNVTGRRRMFKHSFKVRVSTETSTLLSPPLAPPPPPPLMPKTKRKCKAKEGKQQSALPRNNPVQGTQADQIADNSTLQSIEEMQFSFNSLFPTNLEKQSPSETETDQNKAGVTEEANDELPKVIDLKEDYVNPFPMISLSHVAPLSPYQSPFSCLTGLHFPPKGYSSLSPHSSPTSFPSLSPYHSPSASPKSAYSSPYVSQTPSPLPSPPSSPAAERDDCTEAICLELEQRNLDAADENKNERYETQDLHEKLSEEELEMNAQEMERNGSDKNINETPPQLPIKHTATL